jgi:hypothetical protein
VNAAQLKRYEALCSGASRAIGAIDAEDVETLLATLGMAMTTALLTLPPAERFASARRWMQRLASSLLTEDDDAPRSLH